MAPVLLERAAQLSALRDAYARSAGGHGVLVLLAGEAGAGKTALLRQAVGDSETGKLPDGVLDGNRILMRRSPHTRTADGKQRGKDRVEIGQAI